MDVNKKVSKKIREVRLKSGLSQGFLGLRCGWSQQHQSQIEADRCQISVQQVYDLAKALKVAVQELLP